MQIRIDSDKEYTIEDVRVGNTKESMDMIGDFSLLIVDVSSAFGRYIKYRVRSEVSSTTTQATPGPRNAFEVMMAAQGIIHATARTARHPPSVLVKNKRDQLFNDLLSTIESKGLQWRPEEVHCGAATRAIQAIRDTLWYIDGSHKTLTERSCGVPEIFKSFDGYNKPELSKHRKRPVDSLARDLLVSHSQRLFRILQQAFWNRSEWDGFQVICSSASTVFGFLYRSLGGEMNEDASCS